MFNAYPQDIRMWLQEKGGVEKMPLESLWLLFASDLWQMGYRKCETMPMPSVEEQMRALYKEKFWEPSRCEERYTPGCPQTGGSPP